MLKLLSGIGDFVPLIILLVVLVIIFSLIGWVVSVYNKLVKSRNRVDNSWAQIDVQLKRRFDLIPNLVETVKGYTKHEQEIFTEFAKARQMYDSAKGNNSVKSLAEADSSLNKALNIAVNAVQERYPELQANTNYQQLIAELKDCENKIAYNRQFYNDTVLNYMNAKQLFPSNIIASMFSFQDKEYFKVEEKDQREAPKVSF
jgi:LemA protein